MSLERGKVWKEGGGGDKWMWVEELERRGWSDLGGDEGGEVMVEGDEIDRSEVGVL